MGLGDDVAILSDHNLVVTKDLMVAGVHFREKDDLDLVARKLLRVNISDLVAKGAKPEAYVLGCVWPQKTTLEMIEQFVDGLAHDQDHYNCYLIGGDTVRHKKASAPLTLSVTFYGTAPKGGILCRDGAFAGEDLYVTGTVGDAGLGLACLTGRYKPDQTAGEYLCDRYWLPQPRITFGSALTSFASAAMDISDGLLADAGHLADRSDIAIEINGEDIPLSTAANEWLEKWENGGASQEKDRHEALGELATFGDDYEILFTAPSSLRRSVAMAATASKTQVTRIGRTRKGQGVTLLDGDKNQIKMDRSGFDHFS